MLQWSLLLSSLLAGNALAATCGDATLPFTFEVLPDGQPVLGCARPTCWGWQPSGEPAATQNATFFYQINQRYNGFYRPFPALSSPYGRTDPRFYLQNTAYCEPDFSSPACVGISRWVGGVVPLQDVRQLAMVLQCCTHPQMSRSEDRGVATLYGGQIFNGGEVYDQFGRPFGFDYVSDARKVVYPNGSLYYEVDVRRINCTDGGGAGAAGSSYSYDQPNTGSSFSQKYYSQYYDKYYKYAVALPPPQCFAADQKVHMADGSTKRMDELQIGDWVLSWQGPRVAPSRITVWLHRESATEAEFIRLRLGGGGDVSMTEQHFIYKGDCRRVGRSLAVSEMAGEAVFASELVVGDCLYTLAEGNATIREMRIVEISMEHGVGIYAPMTENGDIFVNGVAVSCHSIFPSHALQGSFFRHFYRLRTALAHWLGLAVDQGEETPPIVDTLIDVISFIVPEGLLRLR